MPMSLVTRTVTTRVRCPPHLQVALLVLEPPSGRLARVLLLTPPGNVPTGVPSSTSPVAVVLGLLLCLALGALAVQRCRAKAWGRGRSW